MKTENYALTEDELQHKLDTYAQQKAEEVMKELEDSLVPAPKGLYEAGKTTAYNHAIQIIKKHFNLV